MTHCADEIANAVNHPLLSPQQHFRLVTTAGRIAAWREAGADTELIVATIKDVMGRRNAKDGPVRAWGYFDEPMRRAIADKIEMESFNVAELTGPRAQRAKRTRAAESLLAELPDLEPAPRAATG